MRSLFGRLVLWIATIGVLAAAVVVALRMRGPAVRAVLVQARPLEQHEGQDAGARRRGRLGASRRARCPYGALWIRQEHAAQHHRASGTAHRRSRRLAEQRARAEELLHAVGLSDRMTYKATNLSGGQQQRVAIARALSRKPPLLLADEPTGNLDSVRGRGLLVFAAVNRDNATSCLIVTHDPRIAERCDRTITIVDGRVR